MDEFPIDATDYSLADFKRFVKQHPPVVLTGEARGRLARSRAALETILQESSEPIYGINTGFGKLSQVRVEPDDLTIRQLFDRIEHPERNCRGITVQEVILGLNPDMEGDSTGLFLAEELARRGIVVTRLARGIPAGSHLEFASKAVLADAIEGRQSMNH